jgi:hypothetical protein
LRVSLVTPAQSFVLSQCRNSRELVLLESGLCGE